MFILGTNLFYLVNKGHSQLFLLSHFRNGSTISTVVFESNPSSSSLLQKSLKEPKNQVFIISKFGDKIIDSAYEGVIKPLFEKYKINVVRVDKIQDSGKIDDQILSSIAESKYVLADLSSSRPNCYYETGFAHALGKTIILTIRKDESIHFDLAGYRFIQWETESELREELSKRIKHLEDNR